MFRKLDVVFLCSSSIDEAWIRSTAMATAGDGRRVRVVCCDDGGRQRRSVERIYAAKRVPVVFDVSFADAARIRTRLAVTASSGIDRNIFPTRARHLIHMPHSLASLHMIYPAGAFDGYDMLFSAGPHHDAEFEALGLARGIAGRPSIPTGYGKLDLMLVPPSAASDCDVVIAPSWGPDNLLDRCGVEIASRLTARGIRVAIRPHPLFFLEKSPVLVELGKLEPGVSVESPFDGDGALLSASVMVGDYSGTSFEFAALRQRPVVSVDVGRKVVNPAWEDVGLEPVEVALRARLGPVVDADPPAVVETVAALLSEDRSLAALNIAEFLHGRPGDCGRRAADNIAGLLDAA